jgi:MFS family permease
VFAFLDRSRIEAPSGYSRWLVPPAALAVHLCIGQAYALSVFNIPLSRVLGITQSIEGDWPLSATIWMFNLAFFCLGLSAALFGRWVERSGPRKAMAASACCFCSGFFIAALGVARHELWLLLLGYGVLGGIGLGIGYIAPVSTLLKWFPDRPGMATGMAIMGFGGGAMLGSPLAMECMQRFANPQSTGVAETFVAMGAIYFTLMSFGAWIVRVPKASTTAVASSDAAKSGMTANEAIKTRAFWLVWVVLFCNVTAGIGVLGQASPMVQEMFSATPQAAAGFVGLLSLFNLVGRFFWSSLSDRLGRKRTYAVYLGLGMLLYAALPNAGAQWLFVACACVILSMYGGGFATVPAYLRDLFGTREVGAIHGRLLTAWSLAAIVGPSAVTYVREAELARGVPKTEVYSMTLYGLVALLAIGLVSNAMVRGGGAASATAKAAAAVRSAQERSSHAPLPWVRMALHWIPVIALLAWGVAETARKAAALFW